MPKKKISRDEILEKASHIFLSKGYHNTSMADIARACNMFKSGLYHYFPDKEALAVEVLNKQFQYTREELMKHFSSRKLSTKNKLETFFDNLIREDSIFKGSVFSLLGSETSGHSASIAQLTKDYYEFLVHSFESLWHGKLSEEAARKRAQIQVCMIEGAMMLSRVNRDPAYLMEVANSISSDTR